ncbi:hypothetical protein M408DRAFT_10484 [Serendipita vermifera MAFF 305830]|uniref:F-box domain-containing protein n=1 Tax=Serendipita vermifera MAFF 305830 TaxID=933852 RepID=A0A0C3AL21_SERVB|nr:hypothetical protein M408DRAFT_10484 [Serendipita vermifera MAFF 305830]
MYSAPYSVAEAKERVLHMIFLEAIKQLLRRPEEDDLVNNVKLLTDDCELAAQVEQTRVNLRGVCRLWRSAFETLKDPFLILHNSMDFTPSAMRVQVPSGCDCDLPGCHLNRPPPLLDSDQIGRQSLEAFLNPSISSQSTVYLIRHQPRIWLLAIAADLTVGGDSFSLRMLSRWCQNLTHLSLSEFALQANDPHQILDLPMLNTLTLNFHCLGWSVSSDLPTLPHPSVQNWNLPQLRNLSLKGWVPGPDEDFFGCVHQILSHVGPTLHGLFYNLWFRSSTGDAIHSLPGALWDWCPHLRTIQSSLKVFFDGPEPLDRDIILIPVFLGDLKTTLTAPYLVGQVWPREVYEKIQTTNWPIERVRIPTTWSTFHRKLCTIYDQREICVEERGKDPNVGFWPTYFWRIFRLILSKGYVLEDRYGVAINSEEREARDAFCWLQWFDEWILVDEAGEW